MKNGKQLGVGQKKGAPNTVIATVQVSIIKKGDPRLVASLLKVMRKKEPVQRRNESIVAFVARHERWAKDAFNAAKAAAPYIHPRLEVWEITRPV